MPDYDFSNMNPTDALFIQASDQIFVTGASASQTTVIFGEDRTYTLVAAGKSLTFGLGLQPLVVAGNLRFEDGSRLHIGTEFRDTLDLRGNVFPGAVYGGDGGDSIVTGEKAWLVQGNQGADTIHASTTSNNTVYGGQGDDIINFAPTGGSATIDGRNFGQGNKGNDSLSGNSGIDTLIGGQGNDTLWGRGGLDFINGNLGDDQIDGYGQLFGEDGADTITTGSTGPSSTLSGGAGNDLLRLDGFFTQGNSHTLLGGDGDDRILSTNAKRDLLDGGAGNDTVQGGNQDNVGDDLRGGDGDDWLVASQGPDTLNGGNGADTLHPGAGADVIYTGDGADIIRVEGSSLLTAGGADYILDWSAADSFNFLLRGYAETTAADFASALAAAQAAMASRATNAMAVAVGGNVIVFAGDDGLKAVEYAFVLVGRTLDDISSANFV